MKIKHTGRSTHRLSSNPIEAAFAQAWAKENSPKQFVNRGHGIAEQLLCGEGTGAITRDLSQQEATAATTIIQWLGSPVGFSWLLRTIQECPESRAQIKTLQ